MAAGIFRIVVALPFSVFSSLASVGLLRHQIALGKNIPS